jgi:L-2-hydroxyglutarate oxidase LhgO
MDVNPEDVIKQLADEIARLNIQLALLKAVLDQKERDGGQED